MPRKQQPKESNQNKKKRKRNIICFNTPCSKSIKTNIGGIFIKLICKHFPPNHKFVTNLQQKHNKTYLFLHAKHQIKNERSQQKNTTTQAHRATKL